MGEGDARKCVVVGIGTGAVRLSSPPICYRGSDKPCAAMNIRRSTLNIQRPTHPAAGSLAGLAAAGLVARLVAGLLLRRCFGSGAAAADAVGAGGAAGALVALKTFEEIEGVRDAAGLDGGLN